MYISLVIAVKRLVGVRMWWCYDLSGNCGALGTGDYLLAIRHILPAIAAFQLADRQRTLDL